MHESLKISNMYAAYTATSNKSDKNLSELSKMVKESDPLNNKDSIYTPEMSMDKVIISKEALESLRNTSLVAEQKEQFIAD